MSSWAAVSHFEIFDVIKNFELCKNDHLKSKKDPVWAEICLHWLYDSGKYRMQPVNLYFYIHQNRNGIFQSYKKYRADFFAIKSQSIIEESNLNEEENSDEITDEVSPDGDFTLHPQDSNHPCKNKLLNFRITFSEAQWALMKPIKKFDKQKKLYYTFKKGWTHIVCELIYVNQKLPCAFNLKSHAIFQDNSTDNDNNFIIKFCGFCTEKKCKAAIYGEGKYDINEKENISIDIIALNTKGIPHKKRRHVSGPLREKFKKELKVTKTENFRARLIEKFQEYGQQMPAIIPSKIVCNKIRQEGLNQELGTEGTLWESLSNLNNNVEFQSGFQQIAFNKFYLFYWTPEQIDVYNDSLIFGPAVSIDATGSIARRILRADNYSNGPIFLYQIVTYVNKLIVPVSQMLSERHDTKIIEFWLKEWFSKKANVPLEVVTDMSKPLQNAICLATNNISYNQYLLMCYRFLINKSKVLVKPYLRIDIAHFIHWVSRLDCFVKVNTATKDFYLRVFGLMSTAENLEILNKLMKTMLKICQHNYGCFSEIEWLSNKIKTFKFDSSIDYKNLKKQSFCSQKNTCEDHVSCHEEAIDIKNIEFFFDESDELSDYIEKIVTDTRENLSSDISINFDDLNRYHCPTILSDLKLILKKFPAWSNVMKRHYSCENNVPTSARSENYFKFIKNDLLENHQPTRVDKFLVKHMRSIFPKMKEARAAIEELKIEQKKFGIEKGKKPTKPKNNSILNIQENWKDQVGPDVNMTLSSEESNTSFDKFVINSTMDFDENQNNLFSSAPIKREIPSDNNTKLLDSAADIDNLISSPVESTDFFLKKTSEDNFSIVLNSEKPTFQLKSEKIVIKRQYIDKSKTTKNSNPKPKRGKYLTPFPEVDIFHSNLQGKQRRKVNKKIIRNGQYIRAYPIEGKKTTCYNTCPFDSLLEILSFSYLNFNNFRNFVDCQIRPNSFFSCLLHYSKFGADVAFYKKRLNYMSSRYSVNNCAINCSDDVSRVFARVMSESNCNIEQTYCSNEECKFEKFVDQPVLNVSVKLLWENGFKSLRDSISQELRKENLYLCDNCKHLSANKKINLTSYLCLNIDHIYEPSIYFIKSNKIQRMAYDLNELPSRLNLNNMSLILSGVIEFVPLLIPQGLGHYIAYTRSINNSWTQINDMEIKSKLFNPKMKEIRAVLLLYIVV